MGLTGAAMPGMLLSPTHATEYTLPTATGFVSRTLAPSAHALPVSAKKSTHARATFENVFMASSFPLGTIAVHDDACASR